VLASLSIINIQQRPIHEPPLPSQATNTEKNVFCCMCLMTPSKSLAWLVIDIAVNFLAKKFLRIRQERTTII
jgi:hypothetical protein